MNDKAIIGGSVGLAVVVIGVAFWLINRTPSPKVAAVNVSMTSKTKPIATAPPITQKVTTVDPLVEQLQSRINRLENENAQAISTVKEMQIQIEQLKTQNSRTTQYQPAASVGAPAQTSTIISGAAWIVRQTGASDVLRGISVWVVRVNLPSSFVINGIEKSIPWWEQDAKRNQDAAKPYAKGGYIESSDSYKMYMDDAAKDNEKIQHLRGVERSLPAIIETQKAFDILKDASWVGVPNFSAPIVAEGKTDVDGKYTISNLPVGRYYLYASMGDTSPYMDWLIPVQAVGGSIKIDLYNDNAATLKN
jgi:TolA-binding protein